MPGATTSRRPGAADTPTIELRAATPADAPGVAAIYDHYVAHSIVTFEEVAVGADEMRRRIGKVQELGLPWLVATEGGRVVGYAYATPWKERRGYRHTVESSVYVDPACTGRGIGHRLYATLLPLLESWGAHAVIGGIALPNDPSIALHERLGMARVAHFRETGTKFGRWIDVGYWEKIFPSNDIPTT